MASICAACRRCSHAVAALAWQNAQAGDYFQIDAQPGQIIDITVDYAPMGANLDVQLLRADAQTGRILAEPVLSREQAATLQPLPRILEELERKYQARATEAELKIDVRQRAYYEVELQLSAGRSIEVHVDAYSGQPIEEDGLR